MNTKLHNSYTKPNTIFCTYLLRYRGFFVYVNLTVLYLFGTGLRFIKFNEWIHKLKNKKINKKKNSENLIGHDWMWRRILDISRPPKFV